METTVDTPSMFEIFMLIAVMFAVVIAGIRSKWKYISRSVDYLSDDPWVNVSEPEIKVRVRRLAILYVIGLLGMAGASIIFILNQSTILSIVALIFAVVGAFAHIFIDLDTGKR